VSLRGASVRLKTQDGIGLQSIVSLFERFRARLGAGTEALRGEVGANGASHLVERPRLADAIAELDATLTAYFHQRADVCSSTEAVVHSLAESVADHTTGLVNAFEELARTGALLVEGIEAERDERRALVDAVGLLAGRVLKSTPAIDARGTEPRLIGGNVDAGPPGSSGGEIVLFDEMADSRARRDAARAPVARPDDVSERVSELERVVEELRRVDPVRTGASCAAPAVAAFAMTPERAVDLTAAMHAQQSSPHRWHRVPPSGGGQARRCRFASSSCSRPTIDPRRRRRLFSASRSACAQPVQGAADLRNVPLLENQPLAPRLGTEW
jgi:hypothetical protein